MAKFYVIKVPSAYGNDMWVTTENGNYRGMGYMPTLLPNKQEAKKVIAYYKALCKNCGKQPSKVEIK